MPTILSHPAIPLALGLGLGLGRRIVSVPLLAAGTVLAVLPDLDIVLLRLGFPYDNSFGHRGFSHSILVALLLAIAGGGWACRINKGFRAAFGFLFLSMVSHGLLDCLTNGGYGVALLWPFSEERFFAPFQPIEVAPLGLGRFFSMRGVEVLVSEMCWVWLPASVLGMTLRYGSDRLIRSK
jgi:inner membrane protein